MHFTSEELIVVGRVRPKKTVAHTDLARNEYVCSEIKNLLREKQIAASTNSVGLVETIVRANLERKNYESPDYIRQLETVKQDPKANRWSAKRAPNDSPP